MPHRLSTLGGLALYGPAAGTPVQGAVAQRRRLALYARLALAGERGLARDRLVDLFWPDAAQERARQALSQAIYLLRREVGHDDVVRGTTSVVLDRGYLAVDACEFLERVTHDRTAAALDVYGGAFLDGINLPGCSAFEHWRDEERRHLEVCFADALELEARSRAATSEYRRAAALWRRRLALDPSSAPVTVALMDALASAGDLPAALQQAHLYESILRVEYELEPGPAVAAAVERLRSGAAGSPSATPPTPVSRGDVLSFRRALRLSVRHRPPLAPRAGRRE